MTGEMLRSSRLVRREKGKVVRPKIKLPRLQIAPECKKVLARRAGRLYFKFAGNLHALKDLKGVDRRAVGMIGEAGWERYSDVVWNLMLKCSHKSKKYRRFWKLYDQVDRQIIAWREYAEGR
jgi:hypothetical protein